MAKLLLSGCLFLLSQIAGAHSMLVYQIETPTPQVHAVLFWIEGCPSCEKVRQQILPQIQERYGSRFQLHQIEVVSIEDTQRLYQIGQAYGLSKEQVGVPLLIIGEDILVGAVQIRDRLPIFVDQYLASGGAGFPDLENLSARLPSDEDKSNAPRFSGMELAAVIEVGMILALLFSTWKIYRALSDAPWRAPSWMSAVIPILSILGLAVAFYLTYVETTSSVAVCGPIGDCNTVQQSPYAKAFGVIPNGLIGMAGYVAILIVWTIWRFPLGDNRLLVQLKGYSPIILWGMAAFGTLYSIYLTYLELFVIRAVCLWCLSSAVIITLVMLASLPACTQWLAESSEQEEYSH